MSTELEAQDSSLQIQLDQLESTCDLVLQERGSGRSADRTEYQKLLKLISSRQVATVTAIRLDRFGRDKAETTHLFDLCKHFNVKIRLSHDGVWSALEHDELAQEEIWEANSHASEAESKRISMRLRRHYKHCDEQGLSTIRKAPLGYQVRQQKLEPNHQPVAKDNKGQIISEWQVARCLIDELLKEESIRSGRNGWNAWLRTLEPIGDGKRLTQLIRFTAEATGHWLEDPSIRGGRKGRIYEQVYDPETREKKQVKREVVPVLWDQHNSILSVNEHKRITAFRERNKASRGALARSGRSSAAGGRSEWIPIHPLLKCAHCGCNFTKVVSGKRQAKKSIHYYCTRRQRNKAECLSKGMSHKTLISHLSASMSDVADQVLNAMSPVSSNTSQIAKLHQSVNALQLAVEASGDSDMQTLLLKKQQQIAELQAEDQRSATQHKTTLKDWEEAHSPDYWEQLLQDPVAGHTKLKQLIEWVTVRDGKPEELKLFRDEEIYWLPAYTAEGKDQADNDAMQELVDAGVAPEEAVAGVIG